MVTVKLSPEVLSILRQSTIAGNSLTLPAGQLERKLYEQVNKALVAAGGKWNRKSAAHLFPEDPRPLLGLESGEVVHVQQTFQEFFTPAELASRMCELGDIKSGMRVLEPSAGRGDIAKKALSLGASVVCCEIQERNAERLRVLPVEDVVCCDFLTEFLIDDAGLFDAAIMNPPFTKGQDRQHVQHAFEFLKPNGVLVSVMSAGVETGTTKSHVAFREWVDDLEGEFLPIPPGTFKESGTGVNTVLLVIRKA